MASVCLCSSATADTVDRDSVAVFGDVRLRYDTINHETLPDDAFVLSGRIRLGGEVKVADWISLLGEIEAVGALIDETETPGAVAMRRPVIPDFDNVELNRLQMRAYLGKTGYATVGRQRLEFDDQRFLGSARFRQNTQSFDAVRLTLQPNPLFSAQIGYFHQVNRPLGTRLDTGTFEGDSWFAVASAQTFVGRLGIYHYALDLETGPDENRSASASSVTTGIRLDGRHHGERLKVDWEAAFAHQEDNAGNPFEYSAQYWLAATTFFLGETELRARFESLGGGGSQSFQTPLASLHRFQGEADVFTTTPVEGVQDVSIALHWNSNWEGPFGLSDITPFARHHFFSAESSSETYGTELDLGLRTNIGGMRLDAVCAFFNSDGFSADRDRVYVSLSRAF
ncbi:MAG: alginate export family protein [Pseudomonadota bacterium]